MPVFPSLFPCNGPSPSKRGSNNLPALPSLPLRIPCVLCCVCVSCAARRTHLLSGPVCPTLCRLIGVNDDARGEDSHPFYAVGRPCPITEKKNREIVRGWNPVEGNVLLGELRNLEQGEAKREPSRTDIWAMRRPPSPSRREDISFRLDGFNPLPPPPFHLPAARPTFHRNDTTLPCSLPFFHPRSNLIIAECEQSDSSWRP